MSSVSPMGNQDKFYDEKTKCWYKADYLGYEGLSEFIVSELLKRSHIKESKFRFVPYQLCSFKIGNKQVIGCCSKNFIKNTESELTLFRFFKLYYGIDITTYTLDMSIIEQIQFVVNAIESITGLSDFGAFLTLILELDAFVLNDDRHYRNISLLKQKDGKFCFIPIFDNGGAFLSDEYSYAGDSLETLINSIESKPFSQDFDEQLDVAEQLYGVQIQFPKNVNYLKEIEKEALNYYTAEQLRRVEYVLRQSIRKYSYLAKNDYEKSKKATSMAQLTVFDD